MIKIEWYSREFDTLEACKESRSPGFFEGVAIFKSPNGNYVHSNLRQQQFSRQEALDLGKSIEELTGYQIMAFHGGLGWWSDIHSKKETQL